MPYVRSPVFRPETIMPVCLCAAKFCAWVLGMLEAHRWSSGLGHERIDKLAAGALSLSSVNPATAPDGPASMPSWAQIKRSREWRKERAARLTRARA